MCTMYLFELFSKSIRVILISLCSNDYCLSRIRSNDNFLSHFVRTNYIKKLIKNITFMQLTIQNHQYMVDYL